MIRIIAEGVYDTPHAVYEAHQVHEWKPDAVFLELPTKPFQKTLNKYNKGKININGLKKQLLKEIGAEEKEVDHTLTKNFLEGEIEAEELEAIEAEGREIHVMKAAKDVGANLYAMDMPLPEVEKEIEDEFKREHIKNAKQVINTKNLPYVVWEINDIIHYPFYIIERLMQHPAIQTTNPYHYNVNESTLCKLAIKWDRGLGNFVMKVLSAMPLSKELKADLKAAHIINIIDLIREEYMAATIIEKYKKLKKKLGREPKVLAIVHLWNAGRLQRMLEGLE